LKCDFRGEIIEVVDVVEVVDVTEGLIEGCFEGLSDRSIVGKEGWRVGCFRRDLL